MHCIVAKIYFKKKKVKFKTVKCYCHTTSDYIRQMKQKEETHRELPNDGECNIDWKQIGNGWE